MSWLAGKVISPAELDGGSFVTLFSKPEIDSVKRPIDGLVFSRPRQGMAVIRAGKWKLLAEVNTKREIQSAKLFNVVEDIAESSSICPRRRLTKPGNYKHASEPISKPWLIHLRQ